MKRSPEGIANAVRMKRRQRHQCSVLIEGKTDSLIFDRVFDPGHCQLEPAQSRANVLGALAILEADGFPGVLGIVDADRWRVSGDLPGSVNIVLTDGCDLESMLLRSPALDKVLAALGSAEKIERFEAEQRTSVRKHLAELARSLGALRYLSERDDLRLRFQKLSFSKFVDRTRMTLDRRELVRTVKNNSQLPSLDEAGLLEELEAKVADRRISSWDLSNGHDMVRILTLGLRQALGPRKLGTRKNVQISAEFIEVSLQLAYEREFFQATKLCAAIRDWERRNPAYSVLVDPTHTVPT